MERRLAQAHPSSLLLFSFSLLPSSLFSSLLAVLPQWSKRNLRRQAREYCSPSLSSPTHPSHHIIIASLFPVPLSSPTKPTSSSFYLFHSSSGMATQMGQHGTSLRGRRTSRRKVRDLARATGCCQGSWRSEVLVAWESCWRLVVYAWEDRREVWLYVER